MNDFNARATFARNIKRYSEMYGKTQSDIAQYMRCSSSTVSDWFGGNKYPRVDKMQRLADFFGIMMSDLTEDKEPTSHIGSELSPEQMKLLGKVSLETIEKLASLTPENLAKLTELIDLYLAHQDSK